MRTRFPLFARLLLWFFVNLLILVAGLVVMIRIQFGSLDNWLLPQSAQDEIQAMSVSLVGELDHSDRSTWSATLAQISAAYKMNFALFDSRGQWMAGAVMDPPAEIRQAMLYAHQRPSPEQPPSGPGMAPPMGPLTFNPQPGEPPPAPGPRPDSTTGPIPDFPKEVIQSHAPSAYWLLVRLPPEPFQASGPVTLAGVTPALGISPLLFDPYPWMAAAGGIVLFSILFWIPMARNLTHSIVKMTRATETIAEGRFDIQLADSRSDELGRLSHAINRMASRLKDFVTGQKRFLGDAAHELCSPLARMEIGLGILEERCDEKALPYVKDVREEVTHMRKLANELLSFSKATLGENVVKLEPISVAEVIAAAVRQEKCEGVVIAVHVPDNLVVLGNFDLLQRAVANLVRNAIHYAGAARPILVWANSVDENVEITVSDEGPGVAPGELEKLFDPFYRVDSSRTATTGGVGLGLAIVKSCVEACKGVVHATNREPHGLVVCIRLQRVVE